MSIRILIADDHTILRQGVRALLEGQGDFEVVGEAGDGRVAVHLAFERKPDVIIMDITMPDLNGIEAARQILAHAPQTRLLFLSMHSDKRFVTRVMHAGAAGYLLKDCVGDELVSAIHQVVAGRTYVSRGVAGATDAAIGATTDPSAQPPTEVLTPREREVLQLLAEGRSTKGIAFHLKVSAKTVETHRLRIMRKLEIFTVAELTKYAIREGLTTPET
ncbi:MAG: Transcriptional regulatory protein DegU [Phycisphaerae bacterium]|nr:Transcriptional regulatory protein DegU [Phycisphaerae bacterium]